MERERDGADKCKDIDREREMGGRERDRGREGGKEKNE